MKAIGIKMVDIVSMSVSMALEHGYKVGNANPNDMGYEITYPDGYKSWCPKDVADAAYFCLSPENDGTKILEQESFSCSNKHFCAGTNLVFKVLSIL